MSGFCPKCGRPAEDGQAFCSGCGAALGGQQPNAAQQLHAQQPYAQQQYAYPPVKPKNKRTLIIILAAGFLLLAGAAIALIFILGPYNAKPKELNGEWDSVLKVESIANEDTSYISKDDLGDEKDTQMKLSLDKDGEGTMVISGVIFEAVYKGGKITAKSMLDDKLEFSLDGMLKKDKDEYTFKGTWKYEIIKGKEKGGVASGSWTAVLVEPEEEEESTGASPSVSKSSLPGANTTEPSETVSTGLSLPSGITAADLEGTWKGQIVMTDIPGLDVNPNISEEDKATMRADIGTSSEMVFIFKNGKLWVGQESDAAQITETDMGALTLGGNSFNADVVTPIGNAHVTGDLVEEGGKKTIQCSLTFPDVPAAGTGTEKVTVVASFSGEKQ